MIHVRFTLLGTGTSAGVPVIGCDCPTCTSDDPRDRRTRSGACLELRSEEAGHRVILFDTSPDLREQALRHGLRRCDAILFTHHHVDHVFGLDDVRRFNALMRAPIDVHAEPRTMTNVRRVFQHIFDAERNVNPSFVATLLPHPLEPGVPLDRFGLRIMPLRLLHGRLPVLGFRIDRLESDGPVPDDDPLPLAYCTDVSSIPPETWPRLEGLRTFVGDALRYKHHPTHFTIDQAIETAERVRPERTIFVHMTHDVLHATLESELPPGIEVGYDGLTLGGLGDADAVRVDAASRHDEWP